MRRVNEFPTRLLRHSFLTLLFLCSLAGISPAVTATQVPHGTLEVVAENTWIAPGQDFTLGLHFILEKGWHIYWVNPGDSGQPPRVTWQLPKGLSAGDIEWPVPHKLGTKSVVDFGYNGEVLLLMKMHAVANLSTAQPAKLDAGVKFLICRDVCIPAKAQISLTLPVKLQNPVADASAQAIFAADRAHLPRTAPANWKFTVSESKDSFVLTFPADNSDSSASHFAEVFFFPLEESQIDNAAPQVLSHTARGSRLTLHKSDQLAKPIQRLKGVLVFSDSTAYLVDAPVTHSAASERKRNPGLVPLFSSLEGEQK